MLFSVVVSVEVVTNRRLVSTLHKYIQYISLVVLYDDLIADCTGEKKNIICLLFLTDFQSCDHEVASPAP